MELFPDFGDDGFTIQTAPLPDGAGVRFAMLRVAYYQQVSGVNYLLSGDGQFGLGIMGIY